MSVELSDLETRSSRTEGWDIIKLPGIRLIDLSKAFESVYITALWSTVQNWRGEATCMDQDYDDAYPPGTNLIFVCEFPKWGYWEEVSHYHKPTLHWNGNLAKFASTMAAIPCPSLCPSLSAVRPPVSVGGENGSRALGRQQGRSYRTLNAGVWTGEGACPSAQSLTTRVYEGAVRFLGGRRWGVQIPRPVRGGCGARTSR